ncbi:MAG: hypothetical protein ACTFAL_08385 [Candidatus Electronema sp. V4]|uniref:hypothetical protein n=1 Tax=Candidatus Electronema sp. V4 TaxID=3454756 RepID=UPI004055645D
MANRINSASRVLEILRKVKVKQDKEKIFEAWSSVFMIDGKEYNKINFEIARNLDQLHGEVEMIRSYMLSTVFEENLYSTYLDRVNNVLAVHLLPQECKDIKNSIHDEILLSLGFCKYILPDEGVLVNDEDITELHSLLSSLELSLSDSTLPDYTKKIIQNNIDRIKSALRSYTIIGVKAFNSVTDSSIGEVVRNQAVFVDTNDPETVTKFSMVLHKLTSITEKIMKADGAITAGKNFVHYGAKALEFLLN